MLNEIDILSCFDFFYKQVVLIFKMLMILYVTFSGYIIRKRSSETHLHLHHINDIQNNNFKQGHLVVCSRTT
jgi:hypothetical protein